jgi:hypothetical protein
MWPFYQGKMGSFDNYRFEFFESDELSGEGASLQERRIVTTSGMSGLSVFARNGFCPLVNISCING